MNRCFEETDLTEWMTQGNKISWSKKESLKKEQLHNHDVPTDYVKTTKGKNKEEDLRLANKPRTILRGEERMPQGNKRNRIIHWSTHPDGQQI